MKQLIRELILWIVVFTIGVYIVRVLGGSELLQGAIATVLAINIDEIVFKNK